MKKFLALILCLSVMTVATACGSKEEAPEEPTDAQTEDSVDSTVQEGETDEIESEGIESEETESEDAETQADTTYTGVLEEKKDFMVVVTSEDKSESYVFNLGEGVECPAEVGETVTVTYTGDITVPVADQDLTATAIAVAE